MSSNQFSISFSTSQKTHSVPCPLLFVFALPRLTHEVWLPEAWTAPPSRLCPLQHRQYWQLWGGNQSPVPFWSWRQEPWLTASSIGSSSGTKTVLGGGDFFLITLASGSAASAIPSTLCGLRLRSLPALGLLRWVTSFPLSSSSVSIWVSAISVVSCSGFHFNLPASTVPAPSKLTLPNPTFHVAGTVLYK